LKEKVFAIIFDEPGSSRTIAAPEALLALELPRLLIGKNSMKKILIALLCMFFSAHAMAAGGLDGFLSKLNAQAKSDLAGFSAKISAQFGIPEAQVNVVISTVKQPADAFMVFQLGQMARQPTDRVMQVYRDGKGKGWGALAKELGIKPGSAEFHALKRGDLHLGDESNEDHGSGKGKGKGKHKD
jgi:uncharacterized protein YdeI (BOF family)